MTAPAPSLFQIRLRAPHTASDAQWTETFHALSENRPACDEVWFSTGIAFPPMDWHREHTARLARYADDLRRAGIVPSLQFQATLGHGDSFGGTPEEMAGRQGWRGFTGPTGVECKACNCPRDPAFLAYVREMARLYAATIRPAWLWIDDDLRINNHRPAVAKEIGCWCDACLKAFAESLTTEYTEPTVPEPPRTLRTPREIHPPALRATPLNEGGVSAAPEPPRTREALRDAIDSSPALYSAWERFSFSSIAAVAAAIAEETHAVSPETRFGYQHGPGPNDSQLAVFRALREAGGGHPVGSRPGGGAYYDLDPNGPVKKAFAAARQRRDLGDPDWIDSWLPEIETYPRAFASRTPRGILLEAIASLAYGMNGLSALIMDTRYETDAWYSENLLAPLAAEREFLERYRDANLGTVPAGLDVPADLPLDGVYAYALTGVPVVPGPGRAFGAMTADDANLKICSCSSSALARLRAEADVRAGGRLPVIVEDPSVGLVVPCVAPDGALRTVLLLNARIDAQKPLTLRLRTGGAGSPPNMGGAASGRADCAEARRDAAPPNAGGPPAAVVWRAIGEKPTTLPVLREGGNALVTVPPLQPWSAGWLAL